MASANRALLLVTYYNEILTSLLQGRGTNQGVGFT